ncbi:XRE family transcriptional regulator [Wohlfahrtiimonas larvae]|uniref:Helix-turn-helix transcriptional regulator n=1 Tax=Wohlfahrtiimonas larvae TaxID=1157986 RepID=A0ABP9N1S5_9GAMM|nr:helix-turn-helix transcriptional regulator [Wohlfahrtiimonas larvae]
MTNFKVDEKLESLNSELSSDELSSEGFTRRLNYLASRHDTVTSLAESAGISISGIQRLLKGGNPTLPVLLKLAKHNNVSVEWLATGNGSIDDVVDQNTPVIAVYDNAGNQVDLNEFTFIPRYNVSASAGHGCAINEESYLFSMAYRTYWIKKYLEVNPKDLIALTAKGDSMTGVIDDRDVMLVDTANKTLSDGIYVLRIDGDLLVKRAQKLPNSIIEISSANPVYRPFQIDMKMPPDDFEVIGAVVHTEPGTLFRYRKN